MLFSVQGWCFDVDIDATVRYSARVTGDHCECGYCRNYYLAVKDTVPSLQPFLAQFGVDIEGPVDFLPVEPTLCMVSYAICGEIVQRGVSPVDLGDVVLSVHGKDELDYTLHCNQPYFVMTTGFVQLPWLLQEDKDEVVSPANEPECLERMYRKLMEQTEDLLILS